VVLDWNQALLNAVKADDSDPEYASRALAMMHAAIYDAVNSIDAAGPSLYVHVTAPAGASDAAGVSQAAHDVLVYLYPAQQSTFDAQLATELANLPDGASKTNGAGVGQTVAAAIIAMRSNDGSTAYVDYTPGSAPGDWQPTYPDYAPAQRPQWANLQPFVMSSDSQFRPAGRPGRGQRSVQRRGAASSKFGCRQQHHPHRRSDPGRQVLERRGWHLRPPRPLEPNRQ
jgi:hypothetical protein